MNRIYNNIFIDEFKLQKTDPNIEQSPDQKGRTRTKI